MPVFYDVLMEKSAQRQEREEDKGSTAKRVALGTGGAVLGIGASHAGEKVLNRATNALYKRVNEGDVAGARKLYDKIDRDKFDVLTSADTKAYFEEGDSPFESLDELDKTFGIKRDETGKAVGTDGDAFYSKAKGGKRGIIYVPLTRTVNPTGILHELGHGTGKLGLGSESGRAWERAVMRSSNLGGPSAVLGAGVGGASALSASTPEQLDRAERTNNIAAGVSGLVQAPRLLEEARANIRAVGLGKKLGVPASKRQLAAAMGTYLGSAAGRTLLPWYANKKIIDYKRGKLSERASD
jgi:hypothetical protein